jgi:hypothetical protein
MAVKILIIGNFEDGFRFYGPVPEDAGLAELEESVTENPLHDQCFYDDIQPFPEA